MAKALDDYTSPTALEKFSKRLPSRVSDVINFPTVSEVIDAAGYDRVKAFVEYELIKLASLVSVGGNLNDMQVSFIAQELLKLYPDHTLADFKICFQRGAIGQYGEILRLDGIVIRGWMKKYIDDKYRVVETQLMEAKDDMYSPMQPLSEDERKRRYEENMKKWKAAVDSVNVKSVTPMPPEEIQREGSEWQSSIERKAMQYKDPHTPEWYDLRDRIRRTASEFYKDRYSFSKMKIFPVKDQEVFAESHEDAVKIYDLAFK